MGNRQWGWDVGQCRERLVSGQSPTKDEVAGGKGPGRKTPPLGDVTQAGRRRRQAAGMEAGKSI